MIILITLSMKMITILILIDSNGNMALREPLPALSRSQA